MSIADGYYFNKLYTDSISLSDPTAASINTGNPVNLSKSLIAVIFTSKICFVNAHSRYLAAAVNKSKQPEVSYLLLPHVFLYITYQNHPKRIFKMELPK